jgi:hypothetical protein
MSQGLGAKASIIEARAMAMIASARARSELTNLDEREPEEIAEHRDQEKRLGLR